MHYENETIKRELHLQKQEVLGGQGYIQFIDCMGSDSSIAQAARTSYGADYGKTVADNRRLIRRLLRDKHTTPFEMAEVQFQIEIPMDAWRQFIRHRTANVNEYSTRYKEAIDRKMTTPKNCWRLQATDNKQGSSGVIGPTIGEHLTFMESQFHKTADELYQERLNAGVAKEQARKDLPLSTFTRAVWKCDLHNVLNFLRLRMDAHAQEEIREYANAMAYFVKQLFPLTFGAFEDYVLEAITLSKFDARMVKVIANSCDFPDEVDFDVCVRDMVKQELLPDSWLDADGNLSAEASECWGKMLRLEIVKSGY